MARSNSYVNNASELAPLLKYNAGSSSESGCSRSKAYSPCGRQAIAHSDLADRRGHDMALWSAGLLLAAGAVLLLSPNYTLAQLKGNICDMDEAKLTEILDCILSKSPQGTLDLWESTKAMFGGRPPAQAVMALCSSSPAAGETLLSEFTNQQTKADKPKFKKALKDCSS